MIQAGRPASAEIYEFDNKYYFDELQTLISFINP